jgi:hypothetical protein
MVGLVATRHRAAQVFKGANPLVLFHGLILSGKNPPPNSRLQDRERVRSRARARRLLSGFLSRGDDFLRRQFFSIAKIPKII